MVNETGPQNVEKYGVKRENLRKSEISGALKQLNPEGIWSPERILQDLKEKMYVKDAEEMGYKGKRVYIYLPKIGNFDGFEFSYFVSENKISQKEYKENPELEKNSHSFSSISKLLENLNKYMKEWGVETDGNMDYKTSLMYYYTDYHNCVAGNYLKDITGLNSRYWVKGSTGGLRVGCRRCSDDYCAFGWDTVDSNLLLK